MKKLILSGVLILAALSMQGCSAVMALNGQKEPDFSIVTKGQSKAIVESQPLKPISTEKLANGNLVSTYQYVMGKEPSAGRAAVYVLLDCVTLFISELVTMPIEMGKNGDIKFLKVEYTPDGQVVRVG
ncbi:hypothetical protein [Fusobacterium sp. SYSU M8D902]|uniref:hypothetical protein n=1 Tax=Fusobacterium sp. SYSU M8D902 TaxID=3159562 RepID=UPI0032E3E057